MGSGIAMVFANAGIPVILKEVSREALDRGLAVIRQKYESSVKRGWMTQQIAGQRLELIRPAHGYEGIAEADIAIEAVYEDVEIKRQVFHELDRVCWPEAILASHTLSLDIDELAAVTSRPFKVVGLHFFAPAHVMKVMEIVRGKSTAPDVITALIALAPRLGKTGVVVGNSRGFVGNREHEAHDG